MTNTMQVGLIHSLDCPVTRPHSSASIYSLYWLSSLLFSFFFFFNDTATTEIYTLSLHDALPICWRCSAAIRGYAKSPAPPAARDRKSTRLNSSHGSISYAVFCLKKKKKKTK